MITRIYKNLEKYFWKGRVLILYGPRRTGKTTLLKHFLESSNKPYKLDTGENIKLQNLFSSRDMEQILRYAEGYDIIAIDEAQNIPHIGAGLKILIDNLPEKTIIATGSSSFELSQYIWEPLTGRKKTLTLYPCSQQELLSIYNKYELQEHLEEFLIYWSYPEVIMSSSFAKKKEILTELVESYLLKDVLALEKIKSPRHLIDLLKLLAFQVGQEVSIHELATKIGIDTKTVSRYLDILEKWFVLVSLGAWNSNLRNEITKKRKYYFLDTGIRNAVINQFNGFDSRNDKGQLWENFVIMEYLKKHTYTQQHGNLYFWRNYQWAEIDLIREYDGKLDCYECKRTKNAAIPEDFVKKYGKQKFSTITTENWLSLLL